MGEIALERQILEGAMRRDQGQGRRHLVELPALYPHPAVLDDVDAAESVRAGEGVDGADQLGGRHLRAVESEGGTSFEGDGELCGGPAPVRGRRGPLESVLRRRHPRILQRPALGGATPEVLVHRIAVRNAGDRDTPLMRERERLLARDHVVADGRQDLQIGREHSERHLEADLVVALARASVRDVLRVELSGHAYDLLGDARTSEARHHWVFALIEGVYPDRGNQVLGREPFHRAHDPHVRGSGETSPVGDADQVLLLSDVHDHGMHLEA
jgi:hypothetical protein